MVDYSVTSRTLPSHGSLATPARGCASAQQRCAFLVPPQATQVACFDHPHIVYAKSRHMPTLCYFAWVGSWRTLELFLRGGMTLQSIYRHSPPHRHSLFKNPKPASAPEHAKQYLRPNPSSPLPKQAKPPTRKHSLWATAQLSLHCM